MKALLAGVITSELGKFDPWLLTPLFFFLFESLLISSIHFINYSQIFFSCFFPWCVYLLMRCISSSQSLLYFFNQCLKLIFLNYATDFPESDPYFFCLLFLEHAYSHSQKISNLSCYALFNQQEHVPRQIHQLLLPLSVDVCGSRITSSLIIAWCQWIACSNSDTFVAFEDAGKTFDQ